MDKKENNKATVIGHIPYGSKNAISRKDLCERTGIADRHIRKYISAAAQDGEIILSLPKGKGYFRFKFAYDLPYLKRFYAIERKRALTIQKRCAVLKAAIKDFTGEEEDDV